jgi:hypothetical protein
MAVSLLSAEPCCPWQSSFSSETQRTVSERFTWKEGIERSTSATHIPATSKVSSENSAILGMAWRPGETTLVALL